MGKESQKKSVTTTRRHTGQRRSLVGGKSPELATFLGVNAYLVSNATPANLMQLQRFVGNSLVFQLLACTGQRQDEGLLSPAQVVRQNLSMPDGSAVTDVYNRSGEEDGGNG